MKTIQYSCKFIALVAIIALATTFAITTIYVNAHTPGAKPEPIFEFKSITLMDGTEVIELSIDQLNKFHAEGVALSTERQLIKQGKSDEEIREAIEEKRSTESGAGPCGISVYRAMLIAARELWEDGIITRSELKIESNWTGGGSIDFCRYLTGNTDRIAVESKGEFVLSNKGKTVDIDIDYPEIKKISKEMNSSSFFYRITNKSTGNSIDFQIAEDIIPEGYFSLRSDAKFNSEVSESILNEFASSWSEFRDNLLLLNDWEIFEGIEEPPAKAPVMALIVIFGVLALIVIMWIVGKTRRF